MRRRGGRVRFSCFGFPVRLHGSTALLPPLFLYLWAVEDMTVREVAWFALVAAGLMGSILVHELGHALVARRYGVQTREIVLLPVGGLARLSHLPQRSLEECWIALAGPAVNFLLALLLFPWLLFVMVPGLRQMAPPTPESLPGNFFFFLPLLFAMNVGLAIFNLLPAFPMDGGRVLRAALAVRLGWLRATRTAAYLGQALALVMAAVGLSGYNHMYLGIAAFIFITARQEYRWAQRSVSDVGAVGPEEEG
ncbi:MAG: hypothetical protein RLY31_1241 [Bacteroidota bacterium]